jgi:hypothetical protein
VIEEYIANLRAFLDKLRRMLNGAKGAASGGDRKVEAVSCQIPIAQAGRVHNLEP